jgi:hypothetical protein
MTRNVKEIRQDERTCPLTPRRHENPRAARKHRELSHCREVSSPGARREASDLHVLEHPPAQWPDGYVRHEGALLLSSWLGNHKLNTGRAQPVNAQTPQLAEANYRERGLVRWLNPGKAGTLQGCSKYI